MTKYNPTRDFLILQPEQARDRTDSGIIIPQQAQRELTEGTIIKKGPETSSEFALGDVVVFTPSSEYRLKVDGEILLVVQSENVILCKPAKEAPAPGTKVQLFPATAPVSPSPKA